MNQLLDISDAKSSLSDYLVENVVTLKGHADFKVEAQAQAGTQRADLTHESRESKRQTDCKQAHLFVKPRPTICR